MNQNSGYRKDILSFKQLSSNRQSAKCLLIFLILGEVKSVKFVGAESCAAWFTPITVSMDLRELVSLKKLEIEKELHWQST